MRVPRARNNLARGRPFAYSGRRMKNPNKGEKE
jgi:hypothetical protein